MTYWAHSNPHQPDADDGQRACALDTRCAERDHKGQAKPGPRVFCSTDRMIIGRSLGWLPEAYDMLHAHLGDKGTGRGERVSSSRSPSTPLNLEVDSILTDMAGLLEGWAERVRAVAALYQVPADCAGMQREAVIVTAAVATLAPHLDALLALPPLPMRRYLTLEQATNLTEDTDAYVHRSGIYAEPELSGADAGLEILYLHRRARSMLGLNPKHQDLPVPCWNPDCGMKTVRRWDGSAGLEDSAECGSCGERYDHERYMLLIRQVAEQQQAKGARRKASA